MIIKLTSAKTRFVLVAVVLLAVIGLSTGRAEAATDCNDTSLGTVTRSYTIPSDQAGDFNLWIRMSAESAGNDSVWFRNDNGACTLVGDTQVPVGSWKWVGYKDGNTNSKITFSNLSAGNHEMKLIGRENSVKVDKVMLVKNSNCTPADMEGNPCLPDKTNPTVSVSTPTTQSGTIQLNAQASDDDANGRITVTFRLNGTNLSPADDTSPYSYALNSTQYTNGTYRLSAIAVDASGNTATSSEKTFTINNTVPDTTPPTVSITNPANSSVQIPEGSFTFSANAYDNVGIKNVTFKLNGQVIGAPTASPYTASTNLTAGSYSLEVTATDTSNLTQTQTMQITVVKQVVVKKCDFSGPSGAGRSDGIVNIYDLATLLASWKKSVSAGTLGDCSGSDNGQVDGFVNVFDLGALLGTWKK